MSIVWIQGAKNTLAATRSAKRALQITEGQFEMETRIVEMANRRMFSLDVVDTDIFLDLPISSQALYFHLGMRADDDGFVSSPKRVTSMICANQDDLKLLIAKGFIIALEDGIDRQQWHL